MSQIRDISRVKGTVFDLSHAMSLSPDDCNVLVVSSRTLFFIQLFGTGEMDFTSRYASSFLDGNKYVLADTSGNLNDINDLVNSYELEVQDMTCDLVAAINALTAATITAGSSCCSPYGEDYPPGAPDLGDPDLDPPPDDWVTWASYYTYKCKAANKIADDWISTLAGLSTLSGVVVAIGALALAAFLNTSLLGGLIVGLIALGFAAGTAAAIVIGALVLMVLSGAGLLLYFAQIADEIEANKLDLVCLLYGATSVAIAKDAIITFTTDIAADLTYDPGDDGTLFQAQLSGLVDALFNDAIINTLFELNSEADVYVGDIDCDDCAGAGEGCYYWTNLVQPFNVIAYGQRDDPPYWTGGGDIFTDSDGGWNTLTIRTVGTYQVGVWYIKNPVYGHPEWGNGANDVYWSETQMSFTIQNMATLVTMGNLGLGGVNSKVRGPGWSSNAYRANTSGSPELASWEKFQLGLDPLREWITVQMHFYYDANYNNAQKGSMRQLFLCSLDLPAPWE